MSGLDVDIEARQGGFTLHARFATPARGLTALFGPSGAGKSTILALVAGLRRPLRGRIAFNDQVLFDSAAGINLPPERRGVGYVFQDALLFPHLTVLANLRYGIGRMAAANAAATLDRLVALLDIGHLLHRRPPGLSGGERQRVAIGRALLSGPRLLLMDEPLAALDPARKAEILPYIEAVRDDWRIPIVYVSHALPEILRLADHAVRMERGQVAASGTLAAVLGHDAPEGEPTAPPSRETGDGGPASIFDMLVAPAEGGDDPAQDGLIRLRFPPAGAAAAPSLLVAAEALSGPATANAPCRVRVAATDVALARQPPEGVSIQNILPCHITRILPVTASPALLDVALSLDGVPGGTLWARVTRRAQRLLDLQVGVPVQALVKATPLDRDEVVATTTDAFPVQGALGENTRRR